MKKEVTYLGVKYDSMRKLAEAFGIKESTLCVRLQSGISLEEALKPVIRKSDNKPKKALYNGVEYPSRNYMCSRLNIKRTSLNNLLDKGVELEEAVNRLIDIRDNGLNPVSIGRNNYKTYDEAARALGTSGTTISRLAKRGKLTEENIEKAIKHGKKCEVLNESSSISK